MSFLSSLVSRFKIADQRDNCFFQYEPITKKRIIALNNSLCCIYQDEQGRTPKFVAVKVKRKGKTPGSKYKEGDQSWIGKIGNYPVGKTDPSRREEILRDLTSSVIHEKLASDLYQVLGRGLFIVPRTMLSMQPVVDRFQKDRTLIKDWNIENTLRIMSCKIKDFWEFSQGRTLDSSRNPISFMDFIKTYRRPPEVLLTDKGTPVPLLGLVEMLAVGRVLADNDILGIQGNNAGYVWITNDKGVIVAARAVKIDPGEALRFEQNSHNRPPDRRDIPYEAGLSTIRWDALLDSQKQIFLGTLVHCLRYKTNPDVLYFLFYRDNRFQLSPTIGISETVATVFAQNMAQWLNQEETTECFYKELQAFYERHPEKILRIQYIDRLSELQFPTSEGSFPISDFFTQLALIEHQEQRDKEAQQQAQDQNQAQLNLLLLERDSLRESLDRLHKADKTIVLEELFTVRGTGQKPRKALVIGRAGVGKSTLCQKAAHDWASRKLWKNFKAVYWIQLRDCNGAECLQGVNHLEEWLAKAIGHFIFKNPHLVKSLQDHIQQNPDDVLIVCDGFDEASPMVIDFITKRLLSHPRLHILITSRPGVTEALHNRMDRIVENMGFSDEQIPIYAGNFFRRNNIDPSVATQKTEAFISALKANPAFVGMGHNPLHLHLLCVLWEKEGRFPPTLTRLYRNIVSHVFRYKCQREGKNPDDASETAVKARENLFLCLGDIALRGLGIGRLLIAEEEVEELHVPQRYKIQIKQVLSAGLLRASSNEKEYYFLHLTFQEYLAAFFVSRQSHDFISKFVLENRYKPQFRLVFVFLSGLLFERVTEFARLHASLYERIVDSGVRKELALTQDFFTWMHSNGADITGFTQLELVIQCLNECPDSDLWKWVDGKYSIKMIFNKFLKNPLITKFIIQLLAKTGESASRELIPRITETIALTLKDNNKNVRAKAAEAIDKVANLALAEHIPNITLISFQALKDWDPEPNVREAATKVLGEIGHRWPEHFRAL